MTSFPNEESRLKNFLGQPWVWMVFSCLLWLVAYRDFFTGQVRITSDAVSYFEHTIYYIENIKRGIFPLWDASWNYGAPNDFFLRRIGCYNPIYFLMSLLSLAGLSHSLVYLLVHAFYFFLGVFGFYFLAKVLYKDERVAFVVFLLLLFSTVGGRIFDSYMCLVIVPSIWFFYFVTVFCLSPCRRYLAGLCLSLMIVVNTYIPLFFLTIVLVVGAFWTGLFFPEARLAGARIRSFFLLRPFFCLFMGGLILLSLIPPAAFFLETKINPIVLTERHGGSGEPHVLAVDKKLLSWGLMEDLFFTGYFTDFRRFLSSLVFIPLFGMLLWVWGGFCRVNRRIILYLSVTVFFVLLGTPLAVPLHAFLHEHGFYFKYMRNLHFFLWFLLVPLGILLSGEFLAQILKMPLQGKRGKVTAFLVVAVSLGGFLAFSLRNGEGIMTTFFVIMASFLLAIWYIFRREDLKGWVLWGAILLVIVPQGVGVFHYITRNFPLGGPYGDLPRWNFRYVTGVRPQPLADNGCGSLYYSTDSFNNLCRNISGWAFTSSLTHRLVAYGQVEPMESDSRGHARLDMALQKDWDVAFASGLAAPVILSPQQKPLRVTEDSAVLSVHYADTNTLSLKTNFSQDKFLVYTDSFSRGWRAFIDGKKVPLYPANLAYKGVFVPSGERQVEFRYGSLWWYGFNIMMILVFNALFYALVWAFWRSRRQGALS